MIDVLLLVLAACLGTSCLALAPTPWLLAGVLGFTVSLLAAYLLRRTGLLVAAATLGAASFLGAVLSAPIPRLWHALAFGVGLLALVDVSWDRVRLVHARLPLRTYGRRLAYLGRCAVLSAAAVFVAATLGYGASLRFGFNFPVPVALSIAGVTAASLALLILGALRRWRREPERRT